MFTRLRTKLTVLYAGLFGAALLLVSAAVYLAVAGNAERMVRDELQAGGVIYDRIWTLRSDQLRDGADLLSRDFGFREALASRDEPTLASALDNLRGRLNLDQAFIVDTDGVVHGTDAARIAGGGEALWYALDAQDHASGVLMIDGAPHRAISAPIMAPTLIGWVVFTARLDQKELNALGGLAAIPLQASVLHRDPGGAWMSSRGGRAGPPLSRFVDTALKTRSTRPGDLADASGQAIAVVKPLAPLGQGAPAALVLQFPLATALAPYQGLLLTVIGVGLLGLVLVAWGSWMLARGLTRPITALDEAARKLMRGEAAHVDVDTSDEIGRLAGSFNAMADEIRDREARITHQALHDAETGLLNRTGLQAALEERSEATFVAALGIDRFVFVRGAIGYRLTGELVAEVGLRVQRLLPDAAVGRLSADALGVLFAASGLDAADASMTALLSALEAPVRLEGEDVDVSLTAGLAPVQDADTPVASAIDRASIALDQARAARRKTAAFDPQAYGDPAGNLSLMSQMVEAIRSGEIAIFHQPKHDLRSGRICGAEALVRWRHPVRGMIPPDTFIGMAEETGHIRALTDEVLAMAAADQLRLRAAGHDLAISVNISGRLMSDADFADSAVALVERTGARLCFEITETAVIERPEQALRAIERFAEAGVAISIDDYGSGLSSLTYLKQIRGDELKIDKSFVLSLESGSRDALLVKSTIDLAHSLGMKVTAEGVETAAGLALLTGMGCDVAQGYFIARPMPYAELERFLEAAPEQSRRPTSRPRSRRRA